MSHRKTTSQEFEALQFLNELRNSGATNMLGASPYIKEEFPELELKECRTLLTLWMKNFNEEGDYALVFEPTKN